MASKKRHINNEAELLRAMRSTGYCFPTNDIEQRFSLKLQEEFDIVKLASNIDPMQIWNSDEPKPYKKPIMVVVPKQELDDEISKQWGIAAKGSANISKKIMDKIKTNQDKNKE